jgi:hypothetical protein
LTEKEHEPKVELPYWCDKICPTTYYHHFKQKYWNVLAFLSALPLGKSTLFRLIAPEVVVMPKTSAISKATFSSLRPHAQAFSFVAIEMLDILLGVVLEQIQLEMPSLSAMVILQFIALHPLPEYL